MCIRLSQLATGMVMVGMLTLVAGQCWATFYDLGPSKDEWGLKYDVQVSPGEGNHLNVTFTLADEGRLKPIYSITLIALSLRTDSAGGHSYDVKEDVKFQATADGKRAGTVRIGKEFVGRAYFRVLTQTFDGKRQTAGAVYYKIPLARFAGTTSAAASPEGK